MLHASLEYSINALMFQIEMRGGYAVYKYFVVQLQIFIVGCWDQI